MRFNIVRSSTLYTFRHPNLMLSLLQYISFQFNIDIATFVGFRIAVYAYVVLRTFTYTSPSSPSLRPSRRLVLYNSMIFCLSKLHFGSPCSNISLILHLRIFCYLQAAQMSSTLFQIKQSPQVLEKVLEKVAEVWYECFWERFIQF